MTAIKGMTATNWLSRTAVFTPTRTSPRAPTFRPDVEGLRAVAVGLVVLDHLTGFPRGGFIGVDVFFVISGYLITGLLVRERRTTGRISFSNFYRRRARRILPAAALTIAVTVLAAQLLFLGSRGRQTLLDGVWSLLFAGNWGFALQDTDYFQTSAAPSPLQNFWSLGVEEQFYVVWPLLLLAVFAWCERAPDRRTGRALITVMSVVAVVSFAWSAYESAMSPDLAYFSTLSRGWELAVGALLAVGARHLPALPARLRPALTWVGLLLIGFAAIMIRSTSAFPAPWAILPVVGAALVLGAAAGSGPAIWPLTNPLTSYIGRISYSIYLWHWPVIVIFADAILPSPQNRPVKLAVMGLTGLLILGLAMASFHLIEDPIRHSRWLGSRGGPTRPRPQSAARRWSRPVTVATVMITLAGTGAGVLLSRAVPSAPIAGPVLVAGTDLPSDPTLARDIALGLVRSSWSPATPAIDDLGAQTGAEILRDDACINDDAGDTQKHCVYGDPNGARTAVLIGDSVAMSWLPAIEQALAGKGWRIDAYGKFGCGFASLTQKAKDGTSYQSCDRHLNWVLDRLPSLHPQLVIMGESWGAVPAAGTRGNVDDLWRSGVEKTLQRTALTGARTIVLGAPPYGLSPRDCATRLRSPIDCSIGVPAAVAPRVAVYRSSVGNATHSSFVDTRLWFCNTVQRCPVIIDGMFVRGDRVHLTDAYSRSLGPLLAPVLINP